MKPLYLTFLRSIFAFHLVIGVITTSQAADGQAQTEATTTGVTVIHEGGQELLLPPKPPELTQIPLVRLETEGDMHYARSLNSYLVNLYKRAERPRITEGNNNAFTIKTVITTPPELNVMATGGNKFLGLAKGIGKAFGKDNVIPETLNLDNTNMIIEARCAVEIRLLSAQGEVLAHKSTQIIKTNNLKGLTMELEGFRLGTGSAENAGATLQNLTKGIVLQSLVNQAAYHVTTNFLAEADKIFIATPTAAAPVAVVAAAVPVAEPAITAPVAAAVAPIAAAVAPKADTEWLTPAEAAGVLKVSESDILNALEKGELKGKKIGPVWRINAKDLQ